MPIPCQCPNCHANYKVAESAAGKKIKCAKCATVFSVGQSAASASAPAANAAAAAPPAVVSEPPAGPMPPAIQLQIQTPPGSRASGNLPAKKSSSWLILGGAAAAGLVVVAGIGGWYLLSPPKDETTVAKNSLEKKPNTPKKNASSKATSKPDSSGAAQDVTGLKFPDLDKRIAEANEDVVASSPRPTNSFQQPANPARPGPTSPAAAPKADSAVWGNTFEPFRGPAEALADLDRKVAGARAKIAQMKQNPNWTQKQERGFQVVLEGMERPKKFYQQMIDVGDKVPPWTFIAEEAQRRKAIMEELQKNEVKAEDPELFETQLEFAREDYFAALGWASRWPKAAGSKETAGGAPGLSKVLTGMWAFDVNGMMDAGGEKAEVGFGLMSYGIVFQFNPDGTLEVRGAETGKGTWKIVKEAGNQATVEITHGEKKETLEIKIWAAGEEIEFQRAGQKVPYLYCRPIDAP